MISLRNFAFGASTPWLHALVWSARYRSRRPKQRNVICPSCLPKGPHRGCGFKLKTYTFAPLTFSASAMSLVSRACAASLTSLLSSALIKDEGRLYATRTFPLEGSS